MATERTIRLLRHKLHVLKFNYDKAVAQNDTDLASRWRDGYNHTARKINKLQEDLSA